MSDYAIMWPAHAGRGIERPKLMISHLALRSEHRHAMLSHVRRLWPEEACGILAGPGPQVERVYLIENIRHSRTDYYMDPTQQVNAMIEIEAAGWEVSGIFHSHPAGPAHPSATDIDRALYPDAVYVILAPAGGNDWELRGFEIKNGQVWDVPIHIQVTS